MQFFERVMEKDCPEVPTEVKFCRDDMRLGFIIVGSNGILNIIKLSPFYES
jgi:hypothetical protein